MGSKKKSSASAAQAAADLYAKTGTTSIPAGNFAFGARFMGQLSPGVGDEGSPSCTNIAEQQTSLRVQKCIQHLSKHDARTRQRALSALKNSLEEDSSDAIGLLEYWSKQFPKLMKDPCKHVRIGSCELTLTLSLCVGRGMGKIIKDVFPPLFFAQYDEHDVALVASSVLQAMLPGNKMDKAVDMCLDQIVQVMKEGMLSRGTAFDDQTSALSAQYMKGAKAMFRLHSPELSARIFDIVKCEDFSNQCLHGKHPGIRREAYSLIAEMAMTWNGDTTHINSTFIHSVFRCLHDQESQNLLDVLTMIIAFGRQFGNVWEVIDIKQDFYKPLRRIATLVNQNNSLNDVNKSFLPLIALPPSDCCDVMQVVQLLEAIWKAHEQSSHHSKSCMLVGVTIKECINYYICSRGNGNISEFLALMFSSLDRHPVSLCSQTILSTCIKSLPWTEEAIPALLKELESHTDSMVDEQVLATVEPLMASLPGNDHCIMWQLSLLDKSLKLPLNSFWLRSKIDFLGPILGNLWNVMLKEHDAGVDHSSKTAPSLWRMILDSNTISNLREKLIERSLVSRDNASLSTFLSFSVLLDGNPPASFYGILSTLKPNTASTCIVCISGLMRNSVLKSLKSEELDEFFVRESRDAVIATDTEKLHCCITLLKQKVQTDVELISQQCINKATKFCIELMEDHMSIDSRALSLQLLSSIIAYDTSVLTSFDDPKKIWAFTLQTCWEEFLIDLCEYPSVSFDANWREIVEQNGTIQAAEHILKTELSRYSLEQVPLRKWVEESLLLEIKGSGNNEQISSEHNVPMYCLINFCLSLVPERENANILLAFQCVILNLMPAVAIDILRQLGPQGLDNLTKSACGLDIITQTLHSCGQAEISVTLLLGEIVKGNQSYTSIMEYQANIGNECAEVLSMLIIHGLEHKDRVIKQQAIQFCRLELFQASREPWQLTVLTKVASSVRQNESLLLESGLITFTCSLIEEILENSTMSGLNSVGACLGQFGFASTHGWHLLNPGTPVWYSDSKRNNEWTYSKILSRDDSIQPPSYVVEAGASVRETEPNRLRVAQLGAFSLHSPNENLDSTTNLTYVGEELNKMKHLLIYLSGCGDDLFMDTPGCSSVVPFAVHPSVWEDLSVDQRAQLLHQASKALRQSYIEIDRVVEEFSTSLIDKVNEVIGTSFGDLAETLRFMVGLKTNLKLQSVPKINQLRRTLKEAMHDELSSYHEEHAGIIAAAVHIYTALLSRESGFLNKKEFFTQQQRLELDIASIFNGLGNFMSLSNSIFGLVHLSGSHTLRPQLSSLLDPLSLAIQAMVSHQVSLMELMTEMKLRNGRFECVPSILSLCLNNGISCKASRAAFIISLSSTEVANSIWYSDPETFYDKIEGIIADPERHVPDALPDLLYHCGMAEDIAHGIADSSSVDFIPSWSLLVSFLSNNSVENSQKEILVALLKEFSVLTGTLLDYIVGSLKAAPQRLSILDHGKEGVSSKLKGDLSLYLQYYNNEMNTFVANTDGIHIPMDVLLLGLLGTLPVACRAWLIDLQDKQSKLFVEEYVKTKISPLLIREEFEIIDTNDSDGKALSNFNIMAVKAKNQIIASMEVEDGHSIELKVSFPKEYPLKAPRASLEKYVGISEAKARKWNLSIAAFLMNRNGTVSEVIQTWKKNVSQEFEGHEDCLICYSIIQPSTGQLPRLTCKTCHQKYHGTCLYKWFKTSGKSNCVHCQSPW